MLVVVVACCLLLGTPGWLILGHVGLRPNNTHRLPQKMRHAYLSVLKRYSQRLPQRCLRVPYLQFLVYGVTRCVNKSNSPPPPPPPRRHAANPTCGNHSCPWAMVPRPQHDVLLAELQSDGLLCRFAFLCFFALCPCASVCEIQSFERCVVESRVKSFYECWSKKSFCGESSLVLLVVLEKTL